MQRSELHHQEMEARRRFLDDHHCRELELMKKHFKQQSVQLDELHGTKLFRMQTQSKKINDLNEAQRQECLSFIAANIDKLPHSAEPKFLALVNKEFDEAAEQNQTVTKAAQQELS